MKNYICGKCKREFNSKASLKKHKETVCFKREKFAFNILAAFLIFSVLFILLSVHSVHALSFPAGITNYVALNISNSQSTATPNPFQQMINVTSSDSGWTYINNTGNHFGQNVEFFYSNGTVIPSWLENYTSGHAIWWVKVGSIAASSTLTIYMGFTTKTTNLFNNKTTGEAPQLSSTYAEYDDGANVFNFYDNFAGTTLNTTKWTVISGTGYTVDNGLTVTDAAIQSASDVNPEAVILDEFGYISSSNPGTTQFAYPKNSPENYPQYYVGADDTTYYLGNYNDIAVNRVEIGTASNSSSSLFSVWITSAGSYASINYGTAIENTGDFTANTSEPIAFYASTGSEFIQYLRTRAYPPNGDMPSVTFGSVVAVGLTLYLNGVSNANVTITYGTKSNFTAVISPSTDYVSLYVNGTKVASLTQGKAVYLKTLAAGSYKITAATNTSGVSNQTYYEKINKASDYLSLSSNPNINYTYNGTKLNITAKVLSDLNNQLKNITFKVNNMTVKTFNSTAAASYSNAVAGTYTAVINSSGNQNYSSETLKLTIVISNGKPLRAYYLFKTEAGLKNVTAYTTEPLSNIITSNAINNLSVSFYVEYPNGTLSKWQTGYIDKQGNISFADFVSKLDAVGTYKFYVSVAGNENYSSETLRLFIAFEVITFERGSVVYAVTFFNPASVLNR